MNVQGFMMAPPQEPKDSGSAPKSDAPEEAGAARSRSRPRVADLFREETKLVQTKVPEDMHKRIRLWAVEHDMTLQDAVKEAIRRLLESDTAGKD